MEYGENSWRKEEGRLKCWCVQNQSINQSICQSIFSFPLMIESNRLILCWESFLSQVTWGQQSMLWFAPTFKVKLTVLTENNNTKNKHSKREEEAARRWLLVISKKSEDVNCLCSPEAMYSLNGNVFLRHRQLISYNQLLTIHFIWTTWCSQAVFSYVRVDNDVSSIDWLVITIPWDSHFASFCFALVGCLPILTIISSLIDYIVVKSQFAGILHFYLSSFLSIMSSENFASTITWVFCILHNSRQDIFIPMHSHDKCTLANNLFLCFH